MRFRISARAICIRINACAAVPGGALAVIAPGTGLGEAFLTSFGGRYLAYPSEGGHASFAPNDELQIELRAHLHARLGHVSNERVCSGLGLPNIYAFLKDSGHARSRLGWPSASPPHPIPRR